MTSTVQDHPSLQIVRLTPARARDWATCGGHFAAKHLGGTRSPQNYASLLGTAVHELIAACERRGTGQPLDGEAILRAHWRPGRFALTDDAAAREEARPLLDVYLSRRAHEQVEVLASEAFLETPPQKAGSGYSIVLSGRLDRVARRQDGTIEVLAITYYDPPTVVITQMSLRTGATVEVALDSDDIAAGKERLREMARQLQSGAFSLTPSGTCAYCPAREDCPALQNPNEQPADMPF